MAVITCSNFFLLSPSSASAPPPISSPVLKFYKLRFPAAASSSSAASHDMDLGRRKFMEFPHVSSPHRDLMVDLVSTVQNHLGSQLLPCTLPEDVQYYENPTGSAQATLQIRSGHDSSPVDFILGSWIYCQLPTGGQLNITSLSAYLNTSTNAPNFLIELIQSSPTSFVLILDLPPRKDLVVDPEYLQKYYEDTKLDAQRQLLEKLPEVAPYYSSSLYIRSVVSPTAILVRINAETGGDQRMEEIVRDHVSPVAKEVMRIWLECIECGEKEMGEEEKIALKKRDDLVKRKTIEIDLGSSFPRLFGAETAGRVLDAVRHVFN